MFFSVENQAIIQHNNNYNNNNNNNKYTKVQKICCQAFRHNIKKFSPLVMDILILQSHIIIV